jgi:hypothetical protein
MRLLNIILKNKIKSLVNRIKETGYFKDIDRNDFLALRVKSLEESPNKVFKRRADAAKKENTDIGRGFNRDRFCMVQSIEELRSIWVRIKRYEALLKAIKDCNTVRIKNLLDVGVYLGFQDKDGYTPMMKLVLSHNKDVKELVWLFIQKGADPNIPNKENKTLIQLIDDQLLVGIPDEEARRLNDVKGYLEGLAIVNPSKRIERPPVGMAH